MRFMMLMIPNIPTDKSWTPDVEAFTRMGKYNEELAKAGVLLALDGLHGPETGVRVTWPSGSKAKVTDGPFAEAKEVVGGYWMIQVKSREEAIEWAKRIPASPHQVVEVRQVFEMSDFPPELEATTSDIVKAAVGRQ